MIVYFCHKTTLNPPLILQRLGNIHAAQSHGSMTPAALPNFFGSSSSASIQSTCAPFSSLQRSVHQCKAASLSSSLSALDASLANVARSRDLESLHANTVCSSLFFCSLKSHRPLFILPHPFIFFFVFPFITILLAPSTPCRSLTWSIVALFDTATNAPLYDFSGRVWVMKLSQIAFSFLQICYECMVLFIISRFRKSSGISTPPSTAHT